MLGSYATRLALLRLVKPDLSQCDAYAADATPDAPIWPIRHRNDPPQAVHLHDQRHLKCGGTIHSMTNTSTPNDQYMMSSASGEIV